MKVSFLRWSVIEFRIVVALTLVLLFVHVHVNSDVYHVDKIFRPRLGRRVSRLLLHRLRLRQDTGELAFEIALQSNFNQALKNANVLQFESVLNSRESQKHYDVLVDVQSHDDTKQETSQANRESPSKEPIKVTAGIPQDDEDLIAAIRARHVHPPSIQPYKLAQGKKETSMGQAQTIRKLLKEKVNKISHVFGGAQDMALI